MSRILSLDGGGNWCLLQAQILADLYPGCSGIEILKQFDVATANSGGAIVLAALISGMSPDQIVSLYTDGQSLKQIYKRVLLGFPAKWSTHEKQLGIGQLIPSAKFKLSEIGSSLGCRILIPAFNVTTGKLVTFDSDHSDTDYTLGDAVHASSTAPIFYFDKPAFVDGYSLWDGGLTGLNNPAAYATALHYRKTKDRPCVLTIGSASIRNPLTDVRTKSVASPCLIETVKTLVGAMVSDPPNISLNYLDAMTDGKYVRINPVIGPVLKDGIWCVPECYTTILPKSSYKDLQSIAMDTQDLNDLRLIQQFGQCYLQDHIPTEEPHSDAIGDHSGTQTTYYSERKASWNAF